MLADPSLTLVVTVTEWDVLVSIFVEEAGESRQAKKGEAEVQLLDIGEGLDYDIYHKTAYIKTDADGQVRFNNSTYSWIIGFAGFWGANRFQINARFVGQVTPIYKYMFLGEVGWSDPPASNSQGSDTFMTQQALSERRR